MPCAECSSCLICSQLAKGLRGIARHPVAKYMGMAAHELLANSAHHVIKRKIPLLFSNLCLKVHLEEKVAQFFPERCHVFFIERVEHLSSLFHQVLFERLMGLFLVPRTAVRRAQARHDPTERVRGVQPLKRR